MIVGEAPGEEELQRGVPFVGQSGQALTQMLTEAGIIREQCYLTNVFMSCPPGNNIYAWCLKKKEADDAWTALGNPGKYPFTPLKAGAYVDPVYLNELLRLYGEINSFNPTVIVALGNTALWALSGAGGITKSRGTVVLVDTNGPRKYKVIPTYHPAYILRKWEDRPIVIADLMKAKRESLSPDYTRPTRTLWLEPSLDDIEKFAGNILCDAEYFSVDIETARGQITCIGFGTPTHAICIPFWDNRKLDLNYWSTAQDEIQAWHKVKAILQLPQIKLFQNGMYDIIWLWKKMGITVRGPIHDTMLLAHSMFPEMQKSLGFLGSVYTNEASWKHMRPRKRTQQKKGDIEE